MFNINLATKVAFLAANVVSGIIGTIQIAEWADKKFGRRKSQKVEQVVENAGEA